MVIQTSRNRSPGKKMDILQPIINVQNPRNTILSAIYNYKQQIVTTEGMVVWDKQESGNSRSGKGAIEKLAASTIQIAKIEDGVNVKQEIKAAASCLSKHLLTLKSTFSSIT